MILQKFFLVGIVGILWFAGSSLLSAQPPAGQARPAMPVEWTEVVYDTIQAKTWFSGNLRSRRQAVLSAESEGRLVAVAEIGDRFAGGAVVAKLDDTLARQSLLEQKAELAAKKASIVFLNKESKRLHKLAQNNNAALNELDKTQSQLAVARSQLQGIAARIQRSEENIRRMTILAPYDGVIYRRYQQAGEWLESGSSIVAIASTRSVEVETRVPADHLPYIQPGDILGARADEKNYQLRVRTVVPVGDEISHLFDLLLDPLQNMGPLNRIVYISVPISAPRESLLVPEDALVIRNDGVSVFIVDDTMTARRTKVTTGVSNQHGLIEVAGDLQTGDRVVIRGSERLRDGSLVRAVGMPQQSRQ